MCESMSRDVPNVVIEKFALLERPLVGIKKDRTTAFHPKSDGMVERFNKTLATMLTAYVSDHQLDWDKNFPYVLMAYLSA